MLNTSVNRFKVALKFAELLHRELRPSQMYFAIKRNREETDKGNFGNSVCHTHDFIDANEVMDDAIHIVTGKRPSGMLPTMPKDVNDLWNEAWNIAKTVQFDKQILTLCTQL